jgi:hypothetical protein
MTKIPLHIAEKLLLIQQGAIIPASYAKHAVIEDLVDENILQRIGRVQKKLTVPSIERFNVFLQNKFGINNLEEYIKTLNEDSFTRTDLTRISSNSKLKKVRTFKGFLVNSYTTIHSTLNDEPLQINPLAGSFQFIYDFEKFIIPEDVTVVGVENPENFRYINNQKYLFKGLKPLFVSRYPQNQSKDLIKWLQSIPNSYLHFGDLDFAGISIYLNEFKKHLGIRACFLVPENTKNLLDKYGNRNLYDNQSEKFIADEIEEPQLQYLIALLHEFKKGLEQEIFINDYF